MKVPVFCSLIPTEFLVAKGFQPVFVTAEMLGEERASEYHCAFHENLCSYAKTIYDYLLRHENEFGLIVIPASCDAMKKLYNALIPKIPAEKLCFFDHPQRKTAGSVKMLVSELKRLDGKCRHCDEHSEEAIQRRQLTSLDCRVVSPWLTPRNDITPKIAVTGSNVPMETIRDSLAKFGFEAVFLNHCLDKSYPDESLMALVQKGDLTAYAEGFLQKNSCPRTDDVGYKKNIVRQVRGSGIKGMIFNSLKFCDLQPFDLKFFREELGEEFPLLMIEHELTANNEGQTMTRLDAFFERLQNKLGTTKKGRSIARTGTHFVGVDSGSHAAKLVCIDSDRKIVCREVLPTGTSVKKSAEDLMARLGSMHGIREKDIARIVATGYGRNKIAFADDVITEISCHALGAHYILGRDGTVIDIGGQDSKAIRIDKNGGVVRFAMNDKCAAGTGRFLEVISERLGLTLEEFSELAFRAKKAVAISSMCSVFAESEVISLIASGEPKDEIAKGIHRAIAERTIALAKRIDGAPPYYMAGGVAKNKGLVKELEECLGTELKVIEHPQFSGALGAALMAAKLSPPL